MRPEGEGYRPPEAETHEAAETDYAERILGREGVSMLVKVVQEKFGRVLEEQDDDVPAEILAGRYAAGRLLLGLERIPSKQEYWLMQQLKGEAKNYKNVPELQLRRMADYNVIRRMPGTNALNEYDALERSKTARDSAKKLIREFLSNKRFFEAAREAGYFKLAFWGNAERQGAEPEVVPQPWSDEENTAMVRAIEGRWSEGIVDPDEDGIPALRELALAKVLRSEIVQGEDGMELHERVAAK